MSCVDDIHGHPEDLFEMLTTHIHIGILTKWPLRPEIGSHIFTHNSRVSQCWLLSRNKPFPLMIPINTSNQYLPSTISNHIDWIRDDISYLSHHGIEIGIDQGSGKINALQLVLVKKKWRIKCLQTCWDVQRSRFLVKYTGSNWKPISRTKPPCELLVPGLSTEVNNHCPSQESPLAQS